MKYNLTAAVIGSGFMGKTHADVLKNVVENLIICSNDEENGKALAESTGAKFYGDYITMLENEQIDFVSICLPTHLHHYGVMEAAKRKINILCEKPFASNALQAKEMVDAAKENNVLLMVAQPLRFCMYYEYLRKVVKDKRFGKLISIDLYRHSSKPKWSVGNWLNDSEKSGGVICDLHIHETDITTSIFGIPQKVYTRVYKGICHSSFIYDNNKIINTSSSWQNVEDMFEAGYDAVFENASIRHRDECITVRIGNETFNPMDSENFSDVFGEDMYENEIRYFCKCLTEGTGTPLCPAEESSMIMKINEVEIKSALTGQITEVTL